MSQLPEIIIIESSNLCQNSSQATSMEIVLFNIWKKKKKIRIFFRELIDRQAPIVYGCMANIEILALRT